MRQLAKATLVVLQLNLQGSRDLTFANPPSKVCVVLIPFGFDVTIGQTIQNQKAAEEDPMREFRPNAVERVPSFVVAEIDLGSFRAVR
jgi:hypothetical protein